VSTYLSGWSGNGDWSTRDDDCHINTAASIVIWLIATLFALAQCIVGTRRSWLVYMARRHLSLNHHHSHTATSSLRSMIVSDTPFRIMFFYTLHGYLLLPLNAMHLYPNGPRMASSWPLTIGYCISYVSQLTTILLHCYI
jgi:hypothetical protein